MKPEHFLYKSDGLYYMQNMPEKPVANRSGFGMFNMFEYESKLAEYKAALERAKAEAVLVTDPYVYQIAMHSYFPHHIDYSKTPQDNFAMYATQGQVYTINMEEKIEVVEEPELPGFDHTSYSTFRKIARIVAPKKEEESELTQDELNALSSVGIIAKNWYAVSYSKNQMPFAIFESIEYAKLYRDKFSATSIVEPWPMVIKDLRKK